MTRSSARIILTLLMLISTGLAWAQKTDVVFLHNGDRITGEVKSLDRGKLEFKTDHIGTIYIEWEEILEIVSDTGQAIELTNGQRFYGPLSKPENNNMLSIKTGQGAVGVSTTDVITMYPVEATFWQRLDISADLGFSWDKGSEIGKYNLSIDAEYRLPESLTRASFSTELTTQKDDSTTSRANLSGVHSVFRSNKKFMAYFGNLEQNDQLGLELRALLGAGYGWVPIRSQKNWFSLAGGLDINREIPKDGVAETNLEAVGMLTYEYYTYSSPKRDFKFDMRVFPSITDFGRWRVSISSDFRFELVSDLFWTMGVYLDYDSAPISPEAGTSDYGIVSGISYKFLKLLLIYNISASGGRARHLLPDVRAGLEQFATLEVEVTRQAGHARELVAAADLTDLDGIIAAGGDGTLFEVLNGLYEHPIGNRVPLGLIPVGTGNAFARDLGLKRKDWRKAIDIIAARHKQAFDVGRVQLAGEVFYFLNIVGMGFPVDALRAAKRLRKLGRSAFTLAVLREILRLKSYPLTIEADGERIEQENIFVEVSNTRYTGASFLIAPAAKPDDGLLDVTLLRKLSRWRLLRLFPTIYDGQHIQFPEVRTFRAREVKIIAPAGYPLVPDGEFKGETPATIACLEKDLEFFSPPVGV